MQNWNVNTDNVAINCYDVISCWNGTPTVGQPSCTFIHEGCTWHFCNEQNKKQFEANPGKYVPQFGGYCAWGVSEGKSCSVDPTCYTLAGDKLYFFCDSNAKSQWESNCTTCCPSAESNWSKGQLIAA